MSIQQLASSIKTAVDNRIQLESRIMRGTIQDGKFISGSKSFPYAQAVDCNTRNGNRVYAQLSNDGKAIIVGE